MYMLLAITEQLTLVNADTQRYKWNILFREVCTSRTLVKDYPNTFLKNNYVSRRDGDIISRMGMNVEVSVKYKVRNCRVKSFLSSVITGTH